MPVVSECVSVALVT